MYVFINPKKSTINEPRVTWEEAQKEIAEAKRLDRLFKATALKEKYEKTLIENTSVIRNPHFANRKL